MAILCSTLPLLTPLSSLTQTTNPHHILLNISILLTRRTTISAKAQDLLLILMLHFHDLSIRIQRYTFRTITVHKKQRIFTENKSKQVNWEPYVMLVSSVSNQKQLVILSNLAQGVLLEESLINARKGNLSPVILEDLQRTDPVSSAEGLEPAVKTSDRVTIVSEGKWSALT
jgi:hypothetical protein